MSERLAALVPVGPFFKGKQSGLELTPSDFARALFDEYLEDIESRAGATQLVVGKHYSIAAPLKKRIFADVAARIIQPIVLEMNIARLGGLLTGSDSNQYAEFVGLLRDTKYRAYLRTKYPILFATEEAGISATIDSIFEIYLRLEEDRSAIISEFQVGSASVSDIQFTGDTHNGGRRSAVITFIDGAKLAYKPRSGEMDALYSQIVGIVSKYTNVDLPLARFISRANYTWQEFIEVSQPLNELEYYRQLGVWLAIGHYTGLSDLHYENIIQTTTGPYVIDFECGIYTQVVSEDHIPASPNFFVSSVGILPHWVGAREGHPGMNWGAIGGISEQVPAMKIRSLTKTGTSVMRMEIQDLRDLAKIEPLPMFENEHLSSVIDGFTIGRECIVQSGNQIFSVVTQSSAKTRVIVRPTQIYADALRRACHPLCYQNEVDRKDAIKSVLRSHRGTILQNVEDLESSLLAAGNVPLYQATFTSNRAYECTDSLQNSGVAIRRPSDILQIRLASALDETDFNRQLRLIRQTISVYQNITKETLLTRDWMRRDEHLAIGGGSSDSLSSVPAGLASLAVKEIIADSWSQDSGYKWLNAILLAGKESALRDSSADLYHGSLGTILALAASHIVFGTDLDLDRVRKSLEIVRSSIPSPNLSPPLGAFNGIAGQIFALSSISLLVPSLVDVVEETVSDLLMALESHISRLESCDVISGHAGVLAVVAELSRRSLVDESIAERLFGVSVKSLDALSSQEDGFTVWKSEKEHWLGGFSHGVAGIAWALDQIADPRAHFLADAARVSQDSLRVSGQVRWRDLRERSIRESEFEAWCHGSDGILLSMTPELGQMA